ncbi:MAG: hypothetical protein J4F48_11675 [Nitrospinae bacterium]|nr:hypothetical protein [Nitrospinota bacterium]
MLFDPQNLMTALWTQRPVFHSQVDFRGAFEQSLHELHPNLEIPQDLSFEGKSPDIKLVANGSVFAIELRYFVRKLNATVNGERFELSNQGARDQRGYDLIKDVEWLEKLAKHYSQITGIAILLSNDPVYWNEPRKRNTIYEDFRLTEGRLLNGSLKWGLNASEGSFKGRKTTLNIKGKYRLHWRNYSFIPNDKYGWFRYLMINVSQGV